ncbi:hypothetical protein [Acinetobacter pittii]
MKYIVSALCVMYLPIHAAAESLQDSTNTVLQRWSHLFEQLKAYL